MQPPARLVFVLCVLSLTGCGITPKKSPSSLVDTANTAFTGSRQDLKTPKESPSSDFTASLTLSGASGYLALKSAAIRDSFSDYRARGGGGAGATAGSVDNVALVHSETLQRTAASGEPIIVVVNARNQFAHSLTTNELRRIWQGGSTIETWRDVRSDWPNRPIRRYALQSGDALCEQFGKIAGRESVGSSKSMRARDSETLVGMISADPNAISFMGNFYFNRFKHILRPLAIGDSGVPVLPSSVSIADGSYSLGLRDLSLTLAPPAIPPAGH